jgi:hypothetical protein
MPSPSPANSSTYPNKPGPSVHLSSPSGVLRRSRNSPASCPPCHRKSTSDPSWSRARRIDTMACARSAYPHGHRRSRSRRRCAVAPRPLNAENALESLSSRLLPSPASSGAGALLLLPVAVGKRVCSDRRAVRRLARSAAAGLVRPGRRRSGGCGALGGCGLPPPGATPSALRIVLVGGSGRTVG